ncbi:MAG: lipid-A-disaccharide synthase [Desulfovibrio sp.]
MPGDIWINCSEASGDMYAGALTSELLRRDPGLAIGGMGGKMMARAGARIHFPMHRLCFKGFRDVLRGLPDIFRLHREITGFWKHRRPDVVVMVDCPDFNLPLAKAAHAMSIPVLYFMAPQFWAWKQRGLRILRDCVCRTLCALPFEPSFFHDRGCRALYAGHPLLDMIPLRSLDALVPDPQHIGIMPGSREKEISFLLPGFAEAAARIHGERPEMTFSIARAPGIHWSILRRFWPKHLPVIMVEPEDRFRMIRKSCLVLAASGTATLETGLIGTPTIVSYRLDRPAAYILRKLACSKFISLTNILLGRELFPEYLQKQANAGSYHARMKAWLDNPDTLLDIRSELEGLRRIVGPAGGMKAAAKTILEQNNQED